MWVPAQLSQGWLQRGVLRRQDGGFWRELLVVEALLPLVGLRVEMGTVHAGS